MGVRVRRKKGERAAFELRWRAIRTSYPWNTPLSPEDDAFIRAALQNHPYAEQKIGIGIDHFVVDDDGRYSSCVWGVRTDKTRTPISKKACLDQPNPFREFAEACREVVIRDVLDAKNAAFTNPNDPFVIFYTITCPATGLEITYDQAHTHHADPWTFQKIVEAFLESRPDIDRSNLCAYICRVFGMDTMTMLDDPALRKAFYDFHKERARLVVVASDGHTSKGLKGADGYISLKEPGDAGSDDVI